MKRIALSLIVAACLPLAACSAPTTSAQASWSGCKSFDTQKAAQIEWERAGQPAKADRDSDGIVCESLSDSPAGKAKAKKCIKTSKIIAISLPRSKYPATIAHVEQAIAEGQPSVLHIARNKAKSNRAKSLSGIPTKDGFDRDEWPMAMTEEGGSGAHVAYVPSSDNQGAGSSVGGQLGAYCNGVAFRLVFE